MSATAARSARMDFSEADLADDDELNDVLWRAIRNTDECRGNAKTSIAVSVSRLAIGKTNAIERERAGEHTGDVICTKRECVGAFQLVQGHRELIVVRGLRRKHDALAPTHVSVPKIIAGKQPTLGPREIAGEPRSKTGCLNNIGQVGLELGKGIV